MTLMDRKRGCLQPAGTFEPVSGFRAGGPFDLNPGEWTDDTAVALALADSIAESGWDLNDQAERYVAWWRGGKCTSNGRVFDIGITTVAALMRFVESGDAFSSGAPEETASGNGSLMRLAPVPIAYLRCFPDQIPTLFERAAESSRPTHASPQCLSACRYFASILAALIYGVDREELLSPDWELCCSSEATFLRFQAKRATVSTVHRGEVSQLA